MFRWTPIALGLLLLGAAAPPAAPAAVPPAAFAGLRWRSIGPLRGGRTVAATGAPNDPNLFYIGSVNGGVWKSQDAGRTWQPIFDAEPTGSIGALGVAWSDPRIIYAGTGEGLQRPDLAIGDGVFKSSDGGKTWRNVGLRHTQQIASLAIDPHDPNRVFVAALGHPYGPNAQRGIFRTTDGGTTWQRVLYLNPNVGGFDVVLDPSNANTVYATLWAARQAPWEITNSFEIAGSGLYKSTDGGTTWTHLTAGLPARFGRAEVAVAPTDPTIVYAFVDSERDNRDAGALYRSRDGGAHFVRVNAAGNIGQRGDDLVSIAVAPNDPNTVYLTNTSTYRSTDGGTTFVAIKGAPGGDDYHNIWINPTHPNIMLLASDQGAVVSVDGGATWSSWYNQPTAEMYHVSADHRFPYWVCGGQQESGSACVESRGNWGEITERDWHPVGAQEYGYVVPDPLHPGIFYGGKVERFDARTGQTQEVSPEPIGAPGYHTVRTEPLAFDHFDKHTLYYGSNVVWATRDGGMHWTTISPDLTRAHEPIPGVIRAFESDDPQHGKPWGVVYALAPSYTHAGTIWAGTDDGLVWRTHDGGKVWSNVTPPNLGPWSKVAQIDASRFDDDTAFVAVNRFRLDDLHPYVYITHDAGHHWKLAVNGLPMEPVNAVRQDPKVPNLLYAAQENGVDVSFDGGAHWQPLQLNLPHTSVRDAIVHENDLIVATHGRGFWILDDVEPLRELARGLPDGTHLFAPELAYRVRRSTNTDTPLPPETPAGENPPNGAIVDYLLKAPARSVTLAIYDARGALVRRYASNDRPPPPIPDLDKPTYWEAPFQPLRTSSGMHRFVWDLHEAPPASITRDLPISAVPHRTPQVPQGALVPPGRYSVVLTVDGTTQRQPLTIAMDPRVRISTAQLRRQYVVAHRIAVLMDRTYAAYARAKAAGRPSAARRAAHLNGDLGALLGVVDGADAPPTRAALAAFARLRAAARRLDRQPAPRRPSHQRPMPTRKES